MSMIRLSKSVTDNNTIYPFIFHLLFLKAPKFSFRNVETFISGCSKLWLSSNSSYLIFVIAVNFQGLSCVLSVFLKRGFPIITSG